MDLVYKRIYWLIIKSDLMINISKAKSQKLL